MSASDFGDVVGPPPRTALLVCLADVQPEPVTWLWRPYIPRGKVTLLEGDPAAGKTWVALAIAAALSRGWGLPDPDTGRPNATERDPEHIIYLTAEDGLADTLRPRLDAFGADVSRIHALTAVRDGEADSAVTLSDVDVLNDALARTHAALVVIDPLQGFLGSGVDMHRANEVRPVLTGLANLAEQCGCAVLCIRHLSKASTYRTLYRGLGSIDFTAAARSVLLAGRDPNEPNKRALVQIKSNLGREGSALEYEIENDRFTWCGRSELTASALLSTETSDSERGAHDEAKMWLADLLDDGPVFARDVQKQARAAGVADATLRRARASLGVRVARTGGLGAAGAWRWELPKMLKPESEHLNHLSAPDIDEGVIP